MRRKLRFLWYSWIKIESFHGPLKKSTHSSFIDLLSPYFIHSISLCSIGSWKVNLYFFQLTHTQQFINYRLFVADELTFTITVIIIFFSFNLTKLKILFYWIHEIKLIKFNWVNEDKTIITVIWRQHSCCMFTEFM